MAAFTINNLPTVSAGNPGASGFAFIHNLSDLTLWTAASTIARPRLSFVYNDVDGSQMTRRIIRIYTASSGGVAAHTSDVNVVASVGATVTYDSTYGMLNRDQASSERWWTVEVFDNLESSGEVNPVTGATGSRAAFKICWGQAKYESNPGATSSAWSFSNAGVQANTQAAFLFASTALSSDTPSGWKTGISAVTVNAWLHVLVRMSTSAVSTNPSLADMTFSYVSSGTMPDKWKSTFNEAALDTDERRFGSKSLKVQIVAATSGNRYFYPYRKFGTDSADDEIPVLPQTTYTASAFLKTDVPLTGGNLALRICRPFSSTDTLAQSSSITDTSAFPNGWQRVTVTYTTEAGMYLIRPEIVYTRTSGVTEKFWIDAVQNEPGTVATAWHPSLVGLSARLDVSGLMIDALFGGALRLRATLGGTRDIIELGPHGLLFGSDTELYTPNATTTILKGVAGSAHYLEVTGGATDAGVSALIAGDANARAALFTGGLSFGNGTAVRDVSISRSSANTLRLAAGDRFALDWPGCYVQRTTTQSIGNAAWTAIAFDAADVVDLFGMHDPASNNTRITVPWDGVYLYVLGVGLAANGAPTNAYGVGINAAALPSLFTTLPGNTGTGNWGQFAGITVLSASDYIQAWVFQNSGAAVNTAVTSYCSVMYMGQSA